MRYKFLEQIINYDGSQLKPHFIYETCEFLEDSIVAFKGKCNVKKEFMIDKEDLIHGHDIYSTAMLHFICEIFFDDIKTIVLRQRILIDIVKSCLLKLHPNIERKNTDLFINDKKLSISIATVSKISGLIHLGLNIEDKDTPVPVSTIATDPKKLANEIMKKFTEEMKYLKHTMRKVKTL
jgi:hypothetical protein